MGPHGPDLPLPSFFLFSQLRPSVHFPLYWDDRKIEELSKQHLLMCFFSSERLNRCHVIEVRTLEDQQISWNMP